MCLIIQLPPALFAERVNISYKVCIPYFFKVRTALKFQITSASKSLDKGLKNCVIDYPGLKLLCNFRPVSENKPVTMNPLLIET